MRYNVYVVTAAQFVAELYRALVQGRSLGEAVSRGRKNLHEQPVREMVEKLTLQDWLVPIVYEAQSMPVFSPPSHALQLAIDIRPAGSAGSAATSTRRCQPSRTRASSGVTRRCWRSIAALTASTSRCCTPLPAAARLPPRLSSRAGTR